MLKGKGDSRLQKIQEQLRTLSVSEGPKYEDRCYNCNKTAAKEDAAICSHCEHTFCYDCGYGGEAYFCCDICLFFSGTTRRVT